MGVSTNVTHGVIYLEISQVSIGHMCIGARVREILLEFYGALSGRGCTCVVSELLPYLQVLMRLGSSIAVKLQEAVWWIDFDLWCQGLACRLAVLSNTIMIRERVKNLSVILLCQLLNMYNTIGKLNWNADLRTLWSEIKQKT